MFQNKQLPQNLCIAIMVCMVLFIWSYLLADGFEQGNLHDDAGRDCGKIESMLLILAKPWYASVCMLFQFSVSITVGVKNPSTLITK